VVKNVTAPTVEGECWRCGQFLTDGAGSYCLRPSEGDYEFACTHCGAVNSLPKWAEIEQLYRESPSDEALARLKALDAKEGA
jgi:hypothetical protein